ncbi:hypothetical protein P59_251 [Bacillus phage P59]|nr:hypothetical protein P59_022 [Bacillus phage P59]QIW88848.1 hypothetical protein P59_251 [Bacillus phage P59]
MMESAVMDVRMVLGRNFMEGNYETENSDLVKEDFRKIAAVSSELFEKIPYKVIFTEDDHYKSAKDMREKVTETGIIYIFSGNNDHPYLTPEENLKGRAVHDVFAHMVCGCPFSFQGELNAYYEQRKYYPKEVWATLFAEIPMQTAAFYYNGKSFEGITQRAFRATETDMNLVEHMKKDYSANSVLSPEKYLK